MTESHRTYAVALALVVFFVAWAAVSARPWAPTKPDLRLTALQAREQRLQQDGKVVAAIVDRRFATYRAALQVRQAEIARVSKRTLQAAQLASAPTVRIVTLPALTVTRSS